MELLIFISLIIGCLCLASLIKPISEWWKITEYCQEHEKEIENVYQEASTLVNKSSEVDEVLEAYAAFVKKRIIFIDNKYKEYDYILEQEERNRELRRYYASKKNRRKSW